MTRFLVTLGFGFVELEEIAFHNDPIDLGSLTIKHLNVDILTQQKAFFFFVGRCLRYLNFEGRKRAGKLASHPLPVPEKVSRPPLCTPSEAHSK